MQLQGVRLAQDWAQRSEKHMGRDAAVQPGLKCPRRPFQSRWKDKQTVPVPVPVPVLVPVLVPVEAPEEAPEPQDET